MITRLHQYVDQLQEFQGIHTLREASDVVDYMAKYSHNLPAPQVFFDVQQIPSVAKTFYSLDKMGIVTFRRRKLRRIKHPP